MGDEVSLNRGIGINFGLLVSSCFLVEEGSVSDLFWFNFYLLKTIDLGFGTISLRDDGIMHLIIFKAFEADVEHLKKVAEAMKELGGGKKYPLLSESPKFTSVTLEARKFLADKKSNPYSSREAFVVTSLPQKMVGNFYLKFDKPSRPTKLFQDRGKAIKWLKLSD